MTPEGPYDDHWIEEAWGPRAIEAFIESGGTLLRPRLRAGIELAGVAPGMKVLDVGCGRGEATLECARRGAEAVGVDDSASVLDVAEAARRNCPEEVQRLSRFIKADVAHLDGGPFDRILLFDIVEHIPDAELLPLLHELRTRLSTGGRLVIHTLPNRWVYNVSYRGLRILLRGLPPDPRSPKEKEVHINEMSVCSLDRILRTCGYVSAIWLRDQAAAQAAWHESEELPGSRGTLYRLLRRPVAGLLFRILAATPARLLLVNDIFAVAAPDLLPRGIRGGLSERISCAAARLFRRGLRGSG